MVALGVFRGSGQSGKIAEYETWLGKPVSHVLDFVGGQPLASTTPWATIDNPSWYFGRWKAKPWKLVMSVAALPNKNFTLAAMARGDYNAHYRKFATVAVAQGGGSSILRPLWENRVKSMPWYAKDREALYVKAFQQFVTTTRSVPGANFEYDFCLLAGGGINAEATYPGDAFVDYIGLDYYFAAVSGATSPEDNFRKMAAGYYSLDWHKKFASSKGKKRSYPEWGVKEVARGGTGDDPVAVRLFVEELRSSSVGYACSFDVNAHDGDHRLFQTVQFPKSAAAYLAAT